MRKAKTLEEIHTYLSLDKPAVFMFTEDWCGDCQYLYPDFPAIEEACPDFAFLQVDRGQFPELAQTWDIFGIPSLIVVEAEKEIGRFVDRNRKTKDQIIGFLREVK